MNKETMERKIEKSQRDIGEARGRGGERGRMRERERGKIEERGREREKERERIEEREAEKGKRKEGR